MFRLPLCPYCKTVYSYKDVKKIRKEKTHICYHCGKKFKAGMFPQSLVLFLIVFVLCIAVNILILSNASDFDTILVIIMLLVTIIFLVAGYFLIPFFTGLKKTDKDEEKQKLKWRI